MSTEKQRIALADFDIVAYRSAAAAEERSVDVLNKSNGNIKNFSTKTEFKKFLENRGFDFDESKYEFTDVQTPEPMENAFQIAKKLTNRLKQEVQAVKLEGYIGGKTNFRLDLDLPKVYKGQREDMIRPVHLTDTKNYLQNKFPGGIIEGVEADDYLVIRSHELIKAGHDPIILTIDKDAKGCVGTSYYDWTQEDAQIVRVPKFGWIEITKTASGKSEKVDGAGLQFLMYQILQGDPVDFYTPRDLHGKRFGSGKAVSMMQECKSVNDIFQATEDQFKEWFPKPLTYNRFDGKKVTKDYRDILNMYFVTAYMRRTIIDETTFYSYWDEMK